MVFSVTVIVRERATFGVEMIPIRLTKRASCDDTNTTLPRARIDKRVKNYP